MDGRPGAAGPGTDSAAQPFWERYGVCSERSEGEAGCSYTSFINVQCRLEGEDGNGRLTRKCERLIRKFRDCGRGKEDLESTTEELIDRDYVPGSSSDRLLREGSQSQRHSLPLDSDVGEALEEFMEYAEKLKRKTAGLGKQSVPLEDSYAVRQLPQELSSSASYEPWYSRFFQRRAQCSPGRQRPWEHLKEDFQEV